MRRFLRKLRDGIQRIRVRACRFRLRGRSRFWTTVILIGAAVMFGLFLFAVRVRPIVAALAKAEGRKLAILAINDAVEAEISTGSLGYSELVTLEKGADGEVRALVTNMARINLIQTRISGNVAENIAGMDSIEMGIPLGDAVGGLIFSGRGVRLPVKVESVTDVQTQFMNAFEFGGINQTRHRISLVVTAELVITVPGGRISADVVTEIPIAETVIIGSVPNIYAKNSE